MADVAGEFHQSIHPDYVGFILQLSLASVRFAMSLEKTAVNTAFKRSLHLAIEA
jgi:hypothetical protein